MTTFSTMSHPVTTIQHAERLHVLSKRIMEREANSVMEIGLRAARAQDRDLLHTLERTAELIGKAAESQFGEHVRRSGGMNVLPVEAQFWKNAYVHASAGRADVVYAAAYGAAAVQCGYCLSP